ncbi:MAG: glycosyltransferase family A protein [Solirubrobacteraceae bacterium]
MATASPRVAVIIPCHNDGPLLLEALDSIVEPEPIEVVVVDDGSTEPSTREILDSLPADRARLIRQENIGLPGARMTGLKATTAPYVFPLDADDMAISGALGRMADQLDGDPQAAVCYGDYVEFDDSELIRAVPEWLDPYRIAYANEYPVSALFRRTALEAAGGWRAAVKTGYEDWNLWMELAETGARALYAGPSVLTYRRRLHGPRMLTTTRRHHRLVYSEMRRQHPRLFSDLARHRRASDMSSLRRILYPVVYGGRRRFAFEQRVKGWLDRRGVWTMRR